MITLLIKIPTSSPPWKGRGFPPHRSHHRLGTTFGGQPSGSENHFHLKGGLSLLSSSPLKEGNNGCSSHSPIKLGKSVISITERNFRETRYL